MNSENPYSSPLTESGELAPSGESLRQLAQTTFLAWEKLRLIYIGVLGLLTVVLGGQSLDSIDYWITVAVGAVVANVCYFAGPIVETYVTWLGYRGKWLRVVLFVSGTIFASVLALAALAAHAIPNQN